MVEAAGIEPASASDPIPEVREPRAEQRLAGTASGAIGRPFLRTSEYPPKRVLGATNVLFSFRSRRNVDTRESCG